MKLKELMQKVAAANEVAEICGRTKFFVIVDIDWVTLRDTEKFDHQYRLYDYDRIIELAKENYADDVVTALDAEMEPKEGKGEYRIRCDRAEINIEIAWESI